MIEIKSETAYKPVQRDHVKLVEQSTNVVFPESYLRFMEISNGGVPVRPILNLGETTIEIMTFLHLVADYKTNKLAEYDVGVMHSSCFYLMRDNSAPIAILRGEDLLCLTGDGADEPEVNIWDSLLSDEDAPVHHHVADSFDEFVEIYERHSSK